MKSVYRIVTAVLALSLALSAGTARAQTAVGTAFTYQGQLKQTGSPANGSFNMVFTLWNDLALSAPANQIGPTLTFDGAGGNPAPVSVANGLFTVPLDFGAGYNGDKRWLEITVGGTTLSPRQPLTPAPYALALPAMRVEQHPSSPNVIGGHSSNNVTGGAYGATIGGGGEGGSANSVTAFFGTVGGGSENTASGGRSTVGGGVLNTASNSLATVGGGSTNVASGSASVIAGGQNNVASGINTTVSGGNANTASGGNTTVGGGSGNLAGFSGGTVSGGQDNVAGAPGSTSATVGGGSGNEALGRNSTVSGGSVNQASGQYSAVSGGAGNEASGQYAAIPGGSNNQASGQYSFAAGRSAKANHNGAFVWGDSIVGDFTSTGLNQFLIRAAGGVGIGTSSPARMLQIGDENVVGSEGMIRLASRSATGSNELRLWDVGVPETGTDVTGEGYSFVIRDANLNSPAPQLMIKFGTGDVGIGTDAPAGKLDVASGNDSYVRVGSTWGDLHFNGGSDGTMGFINEGDPGGSTDFFSPGNVKRLTILNNGNVGIGPGTPGAKLHVSKPATSGVGAFVGDLAPFGTAQFQTNLATATTHAWFAENNNRVFSIEAGGKGYFAGNVGIGTETPGAKLHVKANGPSLRLEGTDHTYAEWYPDGLAAGRKAFTGFPSAPDNTFTIANEIPNANILLHTTGTGVTQVKVLQILGADLTESFNVAGNNPEPGDVVVIDPAHPGELKLCSSPYDSKVAGIISGAGGIRTGVVMGQPGSIADGEYPVAMTGRVYCKCDATKHSIKIGDLLTTSATPAHAMKAVNREKSSGAVIGKAMTPLEHGDRGLVLVLVNLQ